MLAFVSSFAMAQTTIDTAGIIAQFDAVIIAIVAVGVAWVALKAIPMGYRMVASFLSR